MLEEMTASLAVYVIYYTWVAIANTDHGIYNGRAQLRWAVPRYESSARGLTIGIRATPIFRCSGGYRAVDTEGPSACSTLVDATKSWTLRCP